MTNLSRLRSQLTGLRRRRARTRWTIGNSALATAVLVVLGMLMFLDWLLVMNAIQRAVTMVLGIGVVAWVFRRYSLPWLGRRESEIAIAMVLERQEAIDSDLVAALQFESPAAPLWGSGELEQAVIQRAADLGGRVNLRQAVPRRELRRRLALVLTAAAIWAALVMFIPQHVGVFFNRLLFGSHHYPSLTTIAEINVNGCHVEPAWPWLSPIKVPTGGRVQFSVSCTGSRPRRGEVRLTGRSATSQALVELSPTESTPGEYRGELPSLQESVSYQVFVGDAWTDPAALDIVPLPVADVTMEVKPPDYAAGQMASGLLAPGLRQVSVIEGTRVIVRLTSQKRLHKAWLTLAGHKHAFARENANAAGTPDAWILDPADTPLAAVVEPLQYTIQVSDIDGLSLEQPVQGMIHIQPDQRPRVAAGIVTTYVLPNAVPTVHWHAVDDFGLTRVSIVRQITHPDGQAEESEIEIYAKDAGQPLRKDVEADYELKLEPLKLKEDDAVRLTLRAIDYRGSREGQPGQSEPLTLHVTDLQGVLEMVTEPDRKSAEQLKAMVDRQLGIGGGK